MLASDLRVAKASPLQQCGQRARYVDGVGSAAGAPSGRLGALVQTGWFSTVAIGLVLNLRYGLKPSHYAMSMLGALMGLVISGRHVLLHVSGPPGSGYGGAFLGLHLYTWALIVFFCFLIGASVLLLGSAQFETENDSSPRVGWNTSLWARLTSYLIFALCAINAGMAFMECGPLECPENPTGYWIFGH